MFQIIALCIAVPVALGAIAALLFRLDTKREERRKSFIVASQILDKAGFQRLTRVFVDLAVGDWSGAVHETAQFAALAQNPAALALELDGVAKRLIEAKMASKDGITLVESMVAEAKKRAV